MARRKQYHKERVSTSVRLPEELRDRLLEAAEERDVSANWLVCRALEDFLERLIPVEEIRWTRAVEEATE